MCTDPCVCCTVNVIFSLVQTDNNGTLNYEEFQRLLETIGIWKVSATLCTVLVCTVQVNLVYVVHPLVSSPIQKMFFTFDKDRSGTLERGEVANAIRSLGKPRKFM